MIPGEIKDLQFTIPGRVKSKKNSKQIFWKQKIIKSSNAFIEYQEQAVKHIWETVGKPKVIDVNRFGKPIYDAFFKDSFGIRLEFHMKGKAATDGDNMETSIWDILENAGIIDNDKNVDDWSGRKVKNCSEYETKVFIYKI